MHWPTWREGSNNGGAMTTDDTNASDARADEIDEQFRPADRYEVDHLVPEAKAASDGARVRMAGRVMLFRKMGGIAFGQLQDRSGERIQFSLRKNELGADVFKAWAASIAMGDFVGIDGAMWTTDKGEHTVGVDALTVLNKAVRPMPDKWAGVHDTDLRYRKRYLDLLANDDSRARFLTRSRTISHIRRYLDDLDFVEVETPILQAAAAGAAAKPFSTHHNALDRDFYLRISPETYLKRAVAGGLDRVYEIGRNFRNEGIDSSHLQEFTMLEWYAAYWDYHDNMRVIRELIQSTLDAVTGSRTVTVDGVDLDFDGDWPELDFRTEVAERTGIDLRALREVDALRDAVKAAGLLSDDEAASQATRDRAWALCGLK